MLHRTQRERLLDLKAKEARLNGDDEAHNRYRRALLLSQASRREERDADGTADGRDG